MYLNKDYKDMLTEDTIRLSNRRDARFRYAVIESDKRNKSVDYAFMKMSAENPHWKQVDLNIKLCQAVKEEDRARFLEEQNSKRSRDNEELKILESQIRYAYINKGLTLQHIERKSLLDQERFIQHYEFQALQQSRYNDAEFALKCLEQSRKKQQQLKEVLLTQIEDKKRIKEEEIKRNMYERQKLEEDKKRYEEDKQKEALEKMEKKKQLKCEFDTFLNLQTELKKADIERSRKKDDNADKIWKQMDQRLNKDVFRKERMQAQLQRSEQIAKKIEEDMEKKRKFSETLIELLVDEGHAKEEKEFYKRCEKELQARRSAQLHYKNHMAMKNLERLELKKQKKQDYEREIAHFHQFQAEQQQLAEQKRATMLRNHKEMEDNINIRRLYKAEEIKKNIKENLKDAEVFQRRAQHVESTRMEMIKEHAQEVHKFLSWKMLRPSERKYLSTLTK